LVVRTKVLLTEFESLASGNQIETGWSLVLRGDSKGLTEGEREEIFRAGAQKSLPGSGHLQSYSLALGAVNTNFCTVKRACQAA
jgi:hypothetical protein